MVVTPETLIAKMGRTDPESEFLLMRLGQDALDVLICLREMGPLDRRRLADKTSTIYGVAPLDFPNAVHKCKSYGLVKPMRRKTGYWLDLTEKALLFLEYYQVRLSATLKQRTSEK